MALLEVTNGPTAPDGLTLSADTKLVVQYTRPYSDNTDVYPQTYRADYDVTNDCWKPEGSADGTTFKVPGAKPGEPVPPSVKLIESQRYDNAEGVDTFREIAGIFEDVDTDGTWDYGSLPSNYAIVTRADGSGVSAYEIDANADASDDILIHWTETEAYAVTSVNRDANTVVDNASVVWPDGSTGSLTVTSKDSTWLAVNSFTVTHADSGKTVTQPAVTRDSDGSVSVRPALTVA